MKAGLRVQVLLATALAALVVVLVSGVAAAGYFTERQQAAQRSRGQAIAEALAIGLERILALDIALADLQGFDEQCDEALERHAGLSFTLVVDGAGQVLFRSARAASPVPALPDLGAAGRGRAGLQTSDGHSELVLAPARAADGTVVAHVVVGLPRTELQAERRHLLLLIAAAGALALLLVLALMDLALSRLLVRPLRRVAEAVARVRGGDRRAQVLGLERRDDEIGVLAAGFNGLVDTVAERERELLGARDAAEQASRAKTQFLAVMSHELRTPLNAVLGLAEVLARSPLDERQQRLLQQMRGSGRQLAEIIADLLDLSGIEAGRMRVAELPFRLRDAVEEAVERFRPEARRRGLWLTLSLDPALPERLVGDALRVQQVLGNLLSNALKFTEHGGVNVGVTPASGAVRVTVVDTGIGIDAEFLPHVYEAFRQADGTLTRRFGGSGLGLSIARALCDAMGGRIDVASRPGRGTSFWFELPLRLPSAVEAVEAAPPPAPPPLPQLPPLRLLLVEDDALNREFVVQGLAGLPHHVTQARDGTEGLRLLRERRWDAVLLDWRLPGIDGAGLLSVLRAVDGRGTRTRTPVIVLTANAYEDQRQACLDAGADAVLAKPFTIDALLSALQRVRASSDSVAP
jgi:signal transduction histidine kinase/ActR/RegA family two-component response regulator